MSAKVKGVFTYRDSPEFTAETYRELTLQAKKMLKRWGNLPTHDDDDNPTLEWLNVEQNATAYWEHFGGTGCQLDHGDFRRACDTWRVYAKQNDGSASRFWKNVTGSDVGAYQKTHNLAAPLVGDFQILFMAIICHKRAARHKKAFRADFMETVVWPVAALEFLGVAKAPEGLTAKILRYVAGGGEVWFSNGWKVQISPEGEAGIRRGKTQPGE